MNLEDAINIHTDVTSLDGIQILSCTSRRQRRYVASFMRKENHFRFRERKDFVWTSVRINILYRRA
jgi:hypothetical protein